MSKHTAGWLLFGFIGIAAVWLLTRSQATGMVSVSSTAINPLTGQPEPVATANYTDAYLQSFMYPGEYITASGQLATRMSNGQDLVAAGPWQSTLALRVPSSQYMGIL